MKKTYFLFGYDDMLIKQFNDKEWKILKKKDRNNLLEVWIPFRKLSNHDEKNYYFFDSFSEIIGLSEDVEIQEISASILDEMLQFTQTEHAFFFLPPNQMAYISPVLELMKNPPISAFPEYSLLDTNHLVSPNYDENEIYIKDWNRANKGILRSLENMNTFNKEVIAPILMFYDIAHEEGKNIIGVYHQNKKLKLIDKRILLEIDTTELYENKFIMGLIWVWGWGKHLWQWALPCIEIKNIDKRTKFLLTQDKNNSYQLKLENITDNTKQQSKQILLNLKPPIITWQSEETKKILKIFNNKQPTKKEIVQAVTME